MLETMTLTASSHARDDEALPKCGFSRTTRPISRRPKFAPFTAMSCCGVYEMAAKAEDGIGGIQTSDRCKPANCVIENVYSFNGSAVLSSGNVSALKSIIK